VNHGLPHDLYAFQPAPGRYLAFIGRISPEKRVDRAIRIAERAGIKLLIAAKVDRADVEYFEDHIKPLLNNPWVEYLGEIGEREKNEFLGNAAALMFPIDWPEPFGLVMIEAMACGTPTIGYPHGSVPEIIEEGVTGFVVDNERDAADTVEKALAIDRTACRSVFERRFSVERMAQAYAALYGKVIESSSNIDEAKNERAA
jgi:glycosyltransferase involved in cell wall biosynthesis